MFFCCRQLIIVLENLTKLSFETSKNHSGGRKSLSLYLVFMFVRYEMENSLTLFKNYNTSKFVNSIVDFTWETTKTRSFLTLITKILVKKFEKRKTTISIVFNNRYRYNMVPPDFRYFERCRESDIFHSHGKLSIKVHNLILAPFNGTYRFLLCLRIQIYFPINISCNLVNEVPKR